MKQSARIAAAGAMTIGLLGNIAAQQVCVPPDQIAQKALGNAQAYVEATRGRASTDLENVQAALAAAKELNSDLPTLPPAASTDDVQIWKDIRDASVNIQQATKKVDAADAAIEAGQVALGKCNSAEALADAQKARDLASEARNYLKKAESALGDAWGLLAKWP